MIWLLVFFRIGLGTHLFYQARALANKHYLEYVSDDGFWRKNVVKEMGGKFHIDVRAFPFACALCSNLSSKAERIS